MSIWSDIHRRSNGKQLRKEDLQPELEWPEVVKVSPKIISSNIIDVQPMSQPTGLTFYLL